MTAPFVPPALGLTTMPVTPSGMYALFLVVGALLLPKEEASAHLLLVVLLAVLAVVLLVVAVDQGSLSTN
jgi:hypothetical protein